MEKIIKSLGLIFLSIYLSIVFLSVIFPNKGIFFHGETIEAPLRLDEEVHFNQSKTQKLQPSISNPTRTPLSKKKVFSEKEYYQTLFTQDIFIYTFVYMVAILFLWISSKLTSLFLRK